MLHRWTFLSILAVDITIPRNGGEWEMVSASLNWSLQSLPVLISPRLHNLKHSVKLLLSSYISTKSLARRGRHIKIVISAPLIITLLNRHAEAEQNLTWDGRSLFQGSCRIYTCFEFLSHQNLMMFSLFHCKDRRMTDSSRFAWLSYVLSSVEQVPKIVFLCSSKCEVVIWWEDVIT